MDSERWSFISTSTTAQILIDFIRSNISLRKFLCRYVFFKKDIKSDDLTAHQNIHVHKQENIDVTINERPEKLYI